MEKNQTIDLSEEYLEKIFKDALSYLTLNCSFINDLGLFHGKMGNVLFFVYYSRYSNNKLYENLASTLLDEVYESINIDCPINFENGLCGIGWAIEFLIQNGYMKGDTDDILKDIDTRIMEYDVLRLSDLSFHRGLSGIAFYVIARLSSRRKGKKPFDRKYLSDLKKALLCAEFSKEDECPYLLVETYLKVLSGAKSKMINWPEALCCDILNLSNDFLSLPLGLKNGIAGMLLYYIQNKKNNLEEFSCCINNHLIICDEVSRAANYGIGTYIGLLIKALRDSEWKISVVHLHSSKSKTVFMEQEDEITHIYIPDVSFLEGNNFQKESKKYYRNALSLLHGYLRNSKNMLFVLNYMRMVDWALLLKIQYPRAKIFLTVHYKEWCLALLGNREKLLTALSSPDEEENILICKSWELEKCLLDICDNIIVVAKHSYNDLLSIYDIPETKLIYIPHGIEDCYRKLTHEEFLARRSKYGYTKKEKIIIIAGRLDSAKGVEILIEAFEKLVNEYPQLRLIMVGEGVLNNILPKMLFNCSKISITGFIDKDTLYELYSISDLGVLPSFYEEFGYVSLEMMMMKIPLIVGATSGLLELVENNVTGCTVSLDYEKKNQNVLFLIKSLKFLIDNPRIAKRYARKGRIRYLKKYSFELFKKEYLKIL